MPNSHRTLVESIVHMFATGDTSAAGAVLSATYLDHQGLGEGDVAGPDEFRRVAREMCREGVDTLKINPSGDEFVPYARAQQTVMNDAESGRAWIVQPNRVLPFRFPGIPGPR